MFRRISFGLVLVLASLALAATAVGQSAAKKTLKGTVGPGFTISLKWKGKKVKVLKRGRYTFMINDKGAIHNFVVEKEKGKGKFEKDLTGISFVGKKTMKIKLTKGTWKYYCRPHESQMFGFFKVK